jgi:hypothetical protein
MITILRRKEVFCLCTGLGVLGIIGTLVWNPGVNPDTGPYYRVYSPIPNDANVPGFSYAEAIVTLQTSTQIILNPDSNSTAFVYLGGWGGKSTGGAADAGFMYNRVKQDWSPFIAYRTPTGTKFLASSVRYKAGTKAKLCFSVPQDNTLSLHWEGTPVDNNSPTSGSLEVKTFSGYGWRADGRGCVLKRVTSLGQKPEDLDSGETHAGVVWQEIKIGTNATNAQVWDDAALGGGRQSYPENSQKVRCQPGDSQGSEIVDIRL